MTAKFIGLVTVRTSSTRLPQKTLLPIGNRRVIDHVIDRAKLITGLDGLAVCTSDRPEDDILEKIAEEQKVLCYRGSLEDKLMRFQGAADRFGADYLLLIDADDLFFDPVVNLLALQQMTEEPCDILKSPDGLVPGAFAFLIGVPALKQVCVMKDTTDTEMYETYFLETGRFSVRDMVIKDEILFNDRVRLTLDYQEDLDFFRQVFEGMKMGGNNVSLHDIMQWLTTRPEIVATNLFRHKDYLAKREVMRLNIKIKNKD